MIKEHAVQSIAKTYTPHTEGKGVYVSVAPTPPTVQKLLKWAQVLTVPADEELADDLHATVVWSKQPCNDVSTDASKIHYAQLSHFEYWDGHDNDGYLVCVMHSPDLQALHQKWIDRGCAHSFSDYTAHVTLKSKFKPTRLMYDRMLVLGSQAKGANLAFFNETIEGLKHEV